MSASMRDWISPLVESELNSVLASFGSNYVPGQRLEEGYRVCGPDAVIVHAKKGFEVQVIEFNGRRVHPFEATVSDGTTHIRATFDRVATDLFTKINSRDFLDVRGGIIALVDFKIVRVYLYAVVSHELTAGPKLLILDVLHFIFRGSEGSKPFGRPSDILKNKDILMIIEELEGLLNGDQHASDIQSQPPSPVRSQVDDLSNSGNHSSANDVSQHAFATQVPDRELGRTANQVAEVSRTAFLVDLLSRTLACSGQNDKSSANDNLPEQARATVSGSRKNHVSMPVSDERALAITYKSKAKANKQQTQSPLTSRSQASHQRNPLTAVKNWNPKDTSIPFSDDSEKENSQETLKSRRPKVDGTGGELAQQSNYEQGAAKISIIDLFQHDNPFQGLKRVPRRYARIPDSQQSLLERKDSWYEPQTDSRSPYAIIPANVRDDLTKFLERKSLFKEQSQQIKESEVDGDDSDVDDSDGDDSDDDPQIEDERRIGESRVKKGVEEGMNLFEGERKRMEPWIRLEIPPTEVTNARRRDRGQDYAAHSNDQQKMFRSTSNILDGDMEEADEAGQSEEGDDIYDADLVSWASSPEQRSRQLARRIESSIDRTNSDMNRVGSPELSGSIRPGLGPLITQHGTEMHSSGSAASHFSEPAPAPSLPGRHENNNESQKPQSPGYSRARLIPSSSPVEEEELELAIPHAVGDVVEEIDSEEDKSSNLFQRYPSTVWQNPVLVQVEQTPFPRSHGNSVRSKQNDNTLKRSKTEDDIISSDPRIPATCEAHRSEDTALGFRENEAPAFEDYSDMKTLTVEHRDDGSQHTIRNSVRLSLQDEDEDDSLAQKQLVSEHESSQRNDIALLSTRIQSTISLDRSDSPKRSSPEKQNAAAILPKNLTTYQKLPKQNFPSLGPPLTSEGQFDGSSPPTLGLLKRDGDAFGESPENPAKRHRRVPAASMIMEEEYASRDSKEMARTNRHRFSGRLLLAPETSVLPAPSKSVLNSSKPKEVIPSTNPAVQHVDYLFSEPPVQSSATDGMQHIPATFQEQDVNPRPLVDLQETCRPTHNLQISTNPAVTSRILEKEDSLLAGEEDNVILRGSLLPMTEPETHSQLDFYDEFMCVYPDYSGSRNDFTWALVYLEWLREGKQFLDRALCDDFVRVLSSDFPQYAKISRSLAGSVEMTGWDFFQAQNSNPVFKYEVITPENLQDAIVSLDAEQVAQFRTKFAKSPKTADIKDSVLQQTVTIVAPIESEDALARAKSSEDLVSEEQGYPTNDRDASPELGSAANADVFAPEVEPSFLSEGREASPDLGSVNGSSRAYQRPPRKPYFETHSQRPNAQYQVKTTHSRPPTIGDLTSSDRKTRSRRSLSWSEEESSRRSITPSPESKGKSLSLIALVQQDRGRPPLAGQRNISSSLSRTDLPKETIDDTGKKTEGLTAVKRKLPFGDYVQQDGVRDKNRRKHAAREFLTPNSKKRLCTKPVKPTPK